MQLTRLRRDVCMAIAKNMENGEWGSTGGAASGARGVVAPPRS